MSLFSHITITVVTVIVDVVGLVFIRLLRLLFSFCVYKYKCISNVAAKKVYKENEWKITIKWMWSWMYEKLL